MLHENASKTPGPPHTSEVGSVHAHEEVKVRVGLSVCVLLNVDVIEQIKGQTTFEQNYGQVTDIRLK